MEHFDVVVIGAGMAGLAAAIRIAHFGKKVCVIERHTLWGGLNSFYKKDGYRLDTGLHAVTNYPGDRSSKDTAGQRPLIRLCRQLRIPVDALELEPQRFAQVVFPDASLRFSNDIDELTAAIHERFPEDADGFVRLLRDVGTYPEPLEDRPFVSARRQVMEYIRTPLLCEMIFCPLFFYGGAREHDLDLDTFSVLFNSVYREGLSRPREGIRTILNVLVRRLKDSGAELRCGMGVRQLVVHDGRVTRVDLDDGSNVRADVVVSTAGRVETDMLRSDREPSTPEATGNTDASIAFVESTHVFSTTTKSFSNDASILFFSDRMPFAWRSPNACVDFESGVICIPSNFRHTIPLERPVVRVTHLANPSLWFSLNEKAYVEQKNAFVVESRASMQRFLGANPEDIVYSDAFTPKTILRYTGHRMGAVYGSSMKSKTARTHVANLFLAGTDQGLMGIVGAMTSGVAVANRYVLANL